MIPHHFDTAVSSNGNGCGTFTYAGLSGYAAGQGFGIDVTARNAAGSTTVNYDGSLPSAVSRNVTFSEASSLGGVMTPSSSTTAVSAAGFASGVGHGTASYAFAAKQTVPGALQVRASDTQASSQNGAPTEAQVPLRSGRLRIANGFGSEKSALQLQLSTEYWTATGFGGAWVRNTADSCTTLAASAVAQSNLRDNKGATGTWSTTPSAAPINSGTGTLSLSAPSATGTVDLSLNLGSATTDQSCLGTHPGSTGAALPWLRSQNGGCATTFDRDPSARASFGIYSPESQKVVHAREIF